MKFFAALKSAEFATKLFAAAKLDFAAIFAAGDENALKAHLESAVSAAVAAAPAKPDTKAAEQVSTLEGALQSAKDENANIVAANTKLSAALSGIGFTAGDVTAESLKSHIKLHAAELLAQAGHTAVVEAPSVDATKLGTKTASTRAEHYAAMEKLTDPKERTAYHQKHLAKDAQK